MKEPKPILPVIVISQFLCTSLWFAGNGVMHELMYNFGLEQNALAYLTSAVQFGFIAGTLIFAILCIADRYPPSKVFFICALVGALFNIGIIGEGNTFSSILFFRFFTGFFLAGIYPVGMKIASDYYEKGLGKSLGFLVGALVVGTALPHLLKEIKGNLPWEFVLLATSFLALLGGVLMVMLVPEGPYRKPAPQLRLSAMWDIFKKRSFRAAAFGYFGHMWELYAFWAFIPVMLQIYNQNNPRAAFSIPLFSFLAIAIGGPACFLAGYWAQKTGNKRVAFIALLSSCACCLISPFIFSVGSPLVFISFLLFWGMAVIADSPLFSALVAQNAPLQLKGTALTIVNSIGFFITIISIQLISEFSLIINSKTIFAVLALGPIFGLMALIKKK